MKKLSVSLVLLLAVLAGVFVLRSGFKGNDNDTSSSMKEAVAQALAEKYGRPADSYILETDKNTGSYAKGSVRVRGEAGGGLWFAAKTASGWELAFDGNGIMPCETADAYGFPAFMVPGCIDAENGNEMRQR